MVKGKWIYVTKAHYFKFSNTMKYYKYIIAHASNFAFSSESDSEGV
jgi:hypothetical protein